ncbi:MAG: hypothetical protein J0H73_02295 [Salana multivorans]|nr:hypothetical protein [Salana multivorans]
MTAAQADHIAPRYHSGIVDILVRAVPDGDAARIAAGAARLGISQSEYLRRLLHDAVRTAPTPREDLAGSATGMFPPNVLDDLDAEWAE